MVTVRMRRFYPCPRGCRWIDISSESDDETTEVVEDKMRRVALQFLKTLDPKDVYYIHTGPSEVAVYYRRDDGDSGAGVDRGGPVDRVGDVHS